MEWFCNIGSIEGLKREYLNYLRKWKDTDIMKEIKRQYDDLLLSLGAELNYKIETENQSLPAERHKKKFDALSDMYADTLNKIIDFNMNIEVIGQWIWCFDSYEYRDRLKGLGFWYSASKKAWVFSGGKKRMVRSHNKMDDIRNKFGSERVKEKDEA